MSAIAGILQMNMDPIDIKHCKNLMKDLEQYPFDDIQVWYKENLFLGCLAQWITPESMGERVPFYDYERKLVITADAIIDNREELCERLQVKKERRVSITDSQLILLSYEKWGENVPKYLVGDFAFMIWDERERKLFGARDFSGGRTLYFFRNHNQFAFCTTISPLLTLPDVKKQINEKWLAEFLAVSAVVDTVDTSTTPYKSIAQLPPAHCITVSKDNMKIKRYCNLMSGENLKLNSDNEYVEAFQDIFDKAVKSRMRTNKRIGAHLSGGLDSGAVVSFAAKNLKNSDRQLHTFSYIPQKDFVDYTPKFLMPDERPLIKTTVNHIGGLVNHYLDFDGRDSFSEINDNLRILEMPYKYFENSFWMKGIFEKCNEEGIGILLNGGRGNLSISWGSALDYYSLLLKRFQWFQLLKELNLYSRNVGGARYRRLPRIIYNALPNAVKTFSKGIHYTFPSIINPDFAERTKVFESLSNYGVDKTGWLSSSNAYEQRKRHFEDVFHWNATNNFDVKFSLKYSIWNRDPTNDIRVIRFCLSIPENQYVQNGLDRALVRRATEKYLPDKVRLNYRVRGVQGSDWVHRMSRNWDNFSEELLHLSKDKKALEFLNIKTINNALPRILEGPRPERATNPDYRAMMRSLIVYRFIKQFI